jgi:integrase
MNRNGCSSSIGIGVQHGPEYAHKYVFKSARTKNHINQKSIVWDLANHRDSSGLEHWTSHDLRRTVGTGMEKLGCSRVVQDRILNHVDSSISGIYDQHGYDDEAKEWWQKWADHVDSLEANGVVRNK